MSKRKGVSKDEKRTRAMEFLYEKKVPFTMKELEKDLFKQKGIVAQTVEDIVKDLVSDELVDFEKIGATNIYWAFPSKAQKNRENKIRKLESEIKVAESNLASAKAKLKVSIESRSDADRDVVIARYNQLKQELAAVDADIVKFSDIDPEKVATCRKHVSDVISGANRWTDNIFTMKSLFQKSGYVSDADFFARIEFDTDFDYLPTK